MSRLKVIGAPLALALPTAAFAAGSCCAGMACCEEGVDGKKGGDHTGHDVSDTPRK